ncbi:MAG: chemotaxis response regulator protein-glutamate methylesterase [Bryobacterales bacterium]|nr:chemotaxis response regulator protein-glutamate methylesterase [Bryobacterales bacterium]
MSKTRVLIVDDSAIVRKLLAECVSGEKDMEVVGTAPDPFVARDKILALKPDVLTLDIEMPRMDGLTFLKKLMHYQPMPVVVISSLGQAGCQASLEALRLGAVEVLAKPGGPYSVGELRVDLAAKIRAAAAARVRRGTTSATPAPPEPPPKPATEAPRFTASAEAGGVVAIGASTGGTEAIESVLRQLPADGLGIVITQHIPPVFSQTFANRLNAICPMEVKEARDGDSVECGLALVAPGNFHMLLRKSPGGGFRVTVQDGPRVCYQRPSVDVMFCSVAEAAGANAMGVLLTGMGSDGAKGMLKMKQTGARTIAQDEASCVVFGMPKEAIRLGAADQVTALNRIPAAISGFMSRIGR